MPTSPSTKISSNSTKNPNFCTEMISASYSSPNRLSMKCAVFQSISSRSAPSARRSDSDDSVAISLSSAREYGPNDGWSSPSCRDEPPRDFPPVALSFGGGGGGG